MLIDGVGYRSIWLDQKDQIIKIIDQRKLPHQIEIVEIKSLEDAIVAIREMVVRGAPLIGVTAAFGFSLAMRENSSDEGIDHAYARLVSARPTAVNLEWACQIFTNSMKSVNKSNRAELAAEMAISMAEEDVAINKRIGKNGVDIIRQIAAKKHNGEPVSILTHCNAGWLATVDYGTATAPIYEAFAQEIPVKVWVDETRPRNQGASLTAWELYHNNIPHTLIVDNAGGHLMQKGEVDAVIVGSDRTTITGDVCNKIGTYLKALAAFDNGIPFYAAMPVSTIDFNLENGIDIPIEERDADEVLRIKGTNSTGEIETINITIDGVKAANPAFDVTPAKYVTGLITDQGLVAATRESILEIKPTHEQN